ncbi:MAG: UPF0164 family protein [Spirochaetales bacterium]|nr:UPF0164 family protein [Spirochaetales bacterium]
MVRKRLIPLFFFICLSLAHADWEDTYSDLISFAGLDSNSGQNSFLTLLIPAGGKYQSMGTAYTAVAKDAGYLESNPAVSSHLNETELTFYHNDWIDDSNMESVAYTQRKGNIGWGIGGKFLWLPFDETNSWGETTDSGAYTETILTLNGSVNLLGDYYYSGLSLGVNAKAAYRGISESLAEGQSALALMGDVGLLTQFNLLKFYPSRERNCAVGLSVKNLGTEFITDPDPLPSRVTGGISYAPIKPLLLAFDVTYPFNLNGEEAEEISYAMGMDLNMTDFLSLQGGFLLKLGKPRITMGTDLDLEKFSIGVNYTLDLATQFKPVDRIVLSFSLNLGDLGRTTLRDKVQELYLTGLGAYSQGNYAQAIIYWEECLELDETFTPAQEMIATTRKSLELEEKMREQQTVE